MRSYMKLALLTATAAVVLAAAVGTASARNLSVSNQNIRVVWTPLTFSAGGGAVRLECNVTLEGSFTARTIAKTLGSTIGLISRANIARPCRNGTAWAYNGTEVNEVLGGTLANSLPWSITYQGFTGTLPNITGVRLLLLGARFLLRATFLVTLLCNYTTTTAHPAEGIANVEAGGGITGLRADETRSIPSESGGACPEGQFSGTGVVTLLGATTRITIRLI